MEEGLSNDRILWDATQAPSPDDGDFKEFLNCQETTGFKPDPEQCRFWDKAPITRTSYSFGDNGTTATVNAYGDIVQFGTFIGKGHSGMFSADHAYLSEPYMVEERTKELHELATSDFRDIPSTSRFLLHLSSPFEEQPRQTWVNYRWPRYEFKDDSKEMVLQWMVHDNVVLRHCTLKNLSSEDLIIPFEFTNTTDNTMRIRDMDHIDPRYDFNEKTDNYKTWHGLHDYSWILTHDLDPKKSVEELRPDKLKGNTSLDSQVTKPDELDSIAVVVSIFLNGKAVNWANPDQWKISLAGNKKGTTISNISNWLSPDSKNVAEVVVAYKMILVPASKAHWKDFLIPAAYTNISNFINKEPRPTLFLSLLSGPTKNEGEQHTDDGKDRDDTVRGTTSSAKPEGRSGRHERDESSIPENPSGIPERSSSENHIEYIVRRNLEHILSVCSIPLRRPRLQSDNYVSDTKTPVALTCGDMSFHRITASSSYFAFQFLLDIAQRVKQPKLNHNSYAQWLLGRITLVCKGHLQWISENADRLESGCFPANYWVTGVILKQVSPSWRPAESLTDNPFQIIKAGNHATVFPEDKEDSAAIIRSIYSPWLRQLDKIDRRHRFAWPHAQESDISVFRLDDHLWIWKALKIFDELGLWKTTAQQQQLKLNDVDVRLEDQENLKKWARTYGYRNVQREMLRRFTTESDVSRKRMLAVFRSPRETRFLFHARDTALFYEYEDFLLPETSFRQVWENTIEAQKHHDENQETRWDNALRYALAIVMGTAGYSINKEKRPAGLVDSSLGILLKSSSVNGLFAGQLDETTKEPVLFYRESDRDFYYHASFEIPYILLTKAIKINRLSNNRTGDRQGDNVHDDVAELSERLTAQPKHQAMVHGPEGPILSPSESISAIQGKSITKISQVAQQSQTLKKSMPFNRFIDSNSIVEVGEEWLYNYPAFLSQDSALSRMEMQERLARYVIESIGLRFVTGFIMQDGDLAASIIDTDEELRNKLCRLIANNDPELRLSMLEEKENREIRQKFYESLNTPVSQTTREFLASGNMPAQVYAASLVRRSETASMTSSETAEHDPREHVKRFLRHPDVSDVLEKTLREHRGDLLRNVRKNADIRRGIEWLLNGELVTVTRMFLGNKNLYRKILVLLQSQEGHTGQVILRAAKQYLDQILSKAIHGEASYGPWEFPFSIDRNTALVDTKKKRTQGKRGKSDSDTELVWLPNHALWQDYLNVPRTEESAKKRIIYLPKADLEAALICFLGSPELERPPISLFFDRHQNYDLYFFDDTTMSLNTWETELHLSFYQLAKSHEIYRANGIPDVRKDTLPGGKGIQITKASMGFRFFGDFFDRYWTCHFIEFIPANSDIPEWDVSIQFNSKERAWRQRKVLELILFDRILDMLVGSTKKIIERIKYELGVRHGAFSFVNLQSDDYFSSSDHWQESQQALQAIEDHLEHVIVNVAKWETREKDRGMERPRWTRNDEWKYRGDLKKLLASNNSKIRDMHSLHTEIKTLKEFLMSRQDQIRNDLSLRGAENIRFFTYVTVVFLPLGFAASVFSMSAIPDDSLIWQMASTSIIALFLTILALINAEKLGAVAGAISRTIAHYSDERMRGSYLLRHYRKARREERISPYDDEKAINTRDLSPDSMRFRSRSNSEAPGQRAKPGDRNDWHVWFWVVYVLIELPLSRVALGYEALKALKPTSTALFNILLGILFSPWCLIVWVLQVAALNLMDLFRLISQFTKNPFATLSVNTDPFYESSILLLRPNTALRPFLKASLNLRNRRRMGKNREPPPQREREDWEGSERISSNTARRQSLNL